jgi:hypothetical protein
VISTSLESDMVDAELAVVGVLDDRCKLIGSSVFGAVLR